MIIWFAIAKSPFLSAITPITSSLTSFSASLNNSSFLFENRIGIVPVSSSNSINLWPFFVVLISLIINIRLNSVCASSISATFWAVLSSGLLDNILCNFSYLLWKYEIKFSISPLVYDFLLVSCIILKSYSTFDFVKFLLNWTFVSDTFSEASSIISFVYFSFLSDSLFESSIEAGFLGSIFLGVFSTFIFVEFSFLFINGVSFDFLVFINGSIGFFVFLISTKGFSLTLCFSSLDLDNPSSPLILSIISPLTDTKSFDL